VTQLKQSDELLEALEQSDDFARLWLARTELSGQLIQNKRFHFIRVTAEHGGELAVEQSQDDPNALFDQHAVGEDRHFVQETLEVVFEVQV
jgi:hypothetical protein